MPNAVQCTGWIRPMGHSELRLPPPAFLGEQLKPDPQVHAILIYLMTQRTLIEVYIAEFLCLGNVVKKRRYSDIFWNSHRNQTSQLIKFGYAP